MKEMNKSMLRFKEKREKKKEKVTFYQKSWKYLLTSHSN